MWEVMMRRLTTGLLLGAAVCYGPTATAGKEHDMVRMVFTAINEKRVAARKQPLEIDDALNDIAEAHSNSMASHRYAFGHNGFDKRYRIITERWARISAMAENVAKNSSVEKAADAWWRSAGHHKNMLGAYTHTGIGIAKSADGNYYFTQIFVRKQ